MPLNSFRSVPGWPRLFLCFLLGAAWIASSQPVKDEATDVAVLRAEVRRLASELLQHRAEFIQWKMHWMSGELQQIQAERQRFSSERQLIEREIGELNQATTNGAGADDEARKQELNSVQLPALFASERAATMREASLVAALSSESARMTAIQKELQRLEAQAPKHK